ncbi:MAG: type II secretion system F family protein [Armatimonadetes bacterium]|nr:type II secretion system F family protein [Armatimonadota bacterium]
MPASGNVRAGKHAAGASHAARRQQARLPFGRVKPKDLSILARQFSTLVDAGVSMARCLTVLAEQTESARLRAVVQDLRREIEGGATLSTAMGRHPGVFPTLATGLVRAGEVGGALEQTLDRLAAFLEKDLELRRKVHSAMAYPALVMLTAFGIVLFLVTFILPKFAILFKDLGLTKMPGMTQALMDASHFLTRGFPARQALLLAAAAGILLGGKALLRTRCGRRLYDRAKLHVPVFGKLSRRIAIARFARTFGTLLVSGVPVLQAMEAVAGAVDNTVFAEAILKARTAISEGESIGPPLRRSGVFPPMVVHMVTIGEETGALDGMLAKVADFYEQEVDAALQSLTAALEPVMIVSLGGVVGFIVIAMLLPLVDAITHLTDAGGQ